MSKYIDINKTYTTKNGEPFETVILNEKQGIKLPNGVYTVANSQDKTPILSKEVFANITEKCAEGDILLLKETEIDTKNAFMSYVDALNFLPDPFDSWHATGWILSRMGECCFRLSAFKKATQIYIDLMWVPGAIGNPWIHLRKGQIEFEQNDLERAADDLMRAYMGGGKEIFEKENNKYFDFLKSVAKDIN